MNRATLDSTPGPATLEAWLPGLGKRQAEKLRLLGIETVEALLRHYPFRWVDRTVLSTFGSLGPADVSPPRGEGPPSASRRDITVIARVVGSRSTGPPWRRGRSARWNRLEVVLEDETGHGSLVFFGGGWREAHFPVRATVLVSGPLTLFRGRVQFVNPDYEILDAEEEAALHTGVHVPVYPLTRGLTQRQLRAWARVALDRAAPGLPDPLPPRIRERYRLLPLVEALRGIHFPPSPEAAAQARRRLAFEELFLDQITVNAVRLRRETGKASPRIPAEGPLSRRLGASLPFRLTADQARALGQIREDMQQLRPMNRLLQGDVGSGKTVVALLAAAAAADAGYQTAILVPTEILAEQHLRTLRELGGPLGLEPRLLVGSLSRPARKEVLRGLADGSTSLVVGTHALFQDEVRFRRLGLVVVDEQHRFGVLQRVAMLEKGAAPHVLVMSATPIPRSLALVQYADLDLSVIAEIPPGRGRRVTRLTTESRREQVYAFLAERLREGRQVFIIYPLVEDSGRSDLKDATSMARRLGARPDFREHGVALLHGQLPPDAKEAVMLRFVRGEVGVLVATTVIEVGIDVPNAAVMLIEHPERYGLSQLHQLRGRVGRGDRTGYCILLRSEDLPPEAVERLEIFARTGDGFELSRQDLLLRGQGELLGTRQSGPPGFRLADPLRDVKMTEAAREEALALISQGIEAGEGGPALDPLRDELRRRLLNLGARIDVG